MYHKIGNMKKGRNGRYIFGRDPHGFVGFNRSTTNGTGNFDDFRAMAAWAMYSPTPERLEIAAGFGIVVFIPSLLKERVKTHERPVGQESE